MSSESGDCSSTLMRKSCACSGGRQRHTQGAAEGHRGGRGGVSAAAARRAAVADRAARQARWLLHNLVHGMLDAGRTTSATRHAAGGARAPTTTAGDPRPRTFMLCACVPHAPCAAARTTTGSLLSVSLPTIHSGTLHVYRQCWPMLAVCVLSAHACDRTSCVRAILCCCADMAVRWGACQLFCANTRELQVSDQGCGIGCTH
jgi:hypothetical protein